MFPGLEISLFSDFYHKEMNIDCKNYEIKALPMTFEISTMSKKWAGCLLTAGFQDTPSSSKFSLGCVPKRIQRTESAFYVRMHVQEKWENT